MRIFNFLGTFCHGMIAEVNAWEGSLPESMTPMNDRVYAFSMVKMFVCFAIYLINSVVGDKFHYFLAPNIGNLLAKIVLLVISGIVLTILVPVIVDIYLMCDQMLAKRTIYKGEILRILPSTRGGVPLLLLIDKKLIWAHISREKSIELIKTKKEGKVQIVAKAYTLSHLIYEIEGIQVTAKQKVPARRAVMAA